MNTTKNGTLDAINKEEKTIIVSGTTYPCLEKGFDWIDYFKIGDEVNLTITPEGKVGMIAKVTTKTVAVPVEKDPVTTTDKATSNSQNVSVEKKKYMGVTIGMAINNATQICIAEKKYEARDVVLKAKELLEEMEKEGL